MASQHFLTAAYIGGFSSSTTGRPRKRRVFVRILEDQVIRDRPAENLCAQPDLYTVQNSGQVHHVYDLDSEEYESVDVLERDAIDKLWNAYESHVTPSIREISLQSDRTSARTWFYLGQFVADLFVRGPDFPGSIVKRLMKRPEPRARILWPDTVNVHRRTERARILPAVFASQWVVKHAPPGSRFVTSDRALTPTHTPDGLHGYAVPLSPSACLSIYGVASEHAPLMNWDGRSWSTPIPHVDLEPEDVARCNRAMWQYAHGAAFGAERSDLEVLDPAWRTVSEDQMMDDIICAPALSLNGDQRRRHRGILREFDAYLHWRPPTNHVITLRSLFRPMTS